MLHRGFLLLVLRVSSISCLRLFYHRRNLHSHIFRLIYLCPSNHLRLFDPKFWGKSSNLLTSRMKDLYDILFMASQSPFKLISLHKAILSTFHHRMTLIGNRKVIFEEGFKRSKEKQTQWSAFLKRNRLESFSSFSEAIEHMQLFIDPACSEKLGTSGKKILWEPGKWKWE